VNRSMAPERPRFAARRLRQKTRATHRAEKTGSRQGPLNILRGISAWKRARKRSGISATESAKRCRTADCFVAWPSQQNAGGDPKSVHSSSGHIYSSPTSKACRAHTTNSQPACCEFRRKCRRINLPHLPLATISPVLADLRKNTRARYVSNISPCQRVTARPRLD
jgi:hypothetical protein